MYELQIEISIKCSQCDNDSRASMDVTSSAVARNDFLDEGWAVVDGENWCPDCLEAETDAVG